MVVNTYKTIIGTSKQVGSLNSLCHTRSINSHTINRPVIRVIRPNSNYHIGSVGMYSMVKAEAGIYSILLATICVLKKSHLLIC
jgi:hypothetical protein